MKLGLFFCKEEVMVRSALKTWYMKAELEKRDGYDTERDVSVDLMR